LCAARTAARLVPLDRKTTSLPVSSTALGAMSRTWSQYRRKRGSCSSSRAAHHSRLGNPEPHRRRARKAAASAHSLGCFDRLLPTPSRSILAQNTRTTHPGAPQPPGIPGCRLNAVATSTLLRTDAKFLTDREHDP